MTPRLRADFIADWIAHLRTLLLGQGWPAAEVATIRDADVPAHYYDAARRQIAEAPRVIRLADNFSCPMDHQAGWEALQEKIRFGHDLNPHRSLKHASLHNQDGLLGEWGIHHFHLGVGPHRGNPAFVRRTGPILFGLVTGDTFYAIDVFSHDTAIFAHINVLEVIHRNWPDLIKRYRVNAASGEEWSPEQRKRLRRANANVLSKVADGTVYAPIAGGVLASGMNAEATKAGDFWFLRLRAIQDDVQSKLETEILPSLRLNGYVDAPEVEARLQASDAGGLQVFFPAYDVLVRIHFDEPS
ncbi:MAG: hypothetical protein KGL39_53965 [Patescibacteria group bacterium]|nr:hypothetical protein [Patescibacteria group bacterium]